MRSMDGGWLTLARLSPGTGYVYLLRPNDIQMCTNYITTVRDKIRERLNLNPPTFHYEPELLAWLQGADAAARCFPTSD